MNNQEIFDIVEPFFTEAGFTLMNPDYATEVPSIIFNSGNKNGFAILVFQFEIRPNTMCGEYADFNISMSYPYLKWDEINILEKLNKLNRELNASRFFISDDEVVVGIYEGVLFDVSKLKKHLALGYYRIMKDFQEIKKWLK